MFALRLRFDTFGGRQRVFDLLFQYGLMNKTCTSCNDECNVI